MAKDYLTVLLGIAAIPVAIILGLCLIVVAGKVMSKLFSLFLRVIAPLFPEIPSDQVQPRSTNKHHRDYSGGINMAPEGSGLTTLWNDPDKSKIYVDPTALMEDAMGKDLDGDGRIGF